MKLSQGSELPDIVRVAGNDIKVILEETLPNNDYGYFCDATNTIKLAKCIDTECDGKIILTDSQIHNSYYHELIHCFQFYFNNKYDEAQVYANFMCEVDESTNKPF